jgi:5-methylcytosine-specific restriction endonuclease McrA
VNGQWVGSTRGDSLPGDWKRRAAKVLERDEFVCRIAGPHCTVVATECDHIGDRRDHAWGNLRAVCYDCHLRRSAQQGGRAYAAKYNRRRQPEPHPGTIT